MTTHNAVLWRGPSLVDGERIRVVASCLALPSTNRKTGDAVQIKVMPDEVDAYHAVWLGKDVSVCGDCPLCPSKSNVCKACGHENKIRSGLRACQNCGEPVVSCYVVTRFLNSSWKSTTGKSVDPDCIEKVVKMATWRGAMVRFGEYGNMSVIPEEVIRPLFEAVWEADLRWTCYEHRWREPEAQWLKQFSMASCDSVEAMMEARYLGWRTFRHGDDGPVDKLEVECPYFTHHVQCRDCGLCDGMHTLAKGQDRRKSIWCPDH